MNASELLTANFADTGMWRLLLHITSHGMSACLKPVADQQGSPVELFAKEWPDDESSMLSKIEDTVYDNPRLLDDYATDIIIQTPKALQTDADTAEDEEMAAEAFTCVYPALAEDIFTDYNGETGCLYTLTPGLPAFLRRTIPGARIQSHLSILQKRFQTQTSELTRIYADIRQGEADILAFSGRSLLTAATQPWTTPDDVAYRILLLMQAYGLKTDNVDVRLSGIREVKSTTAGILRQMLPYVVFSPEPPLAAEGRLPLAAALML